MTVDEIIQHFPRFREILSGMPRDIELHIERFPANSIIVQKDEPIRKVMILSAGDVVVYNIYEGGEIIYVQSEEVSFISDIELLGGMDHYVCSIQTKGECSAISMTPRDFLRWYREDAGLAREIAERLSRRNCRQAQKIGALKYQSTEYRVAKYIIDGSREQLREDSPAVLRITREALAHSVGASERMINRIISQMKKEELLTSGYGSLMISSEQFKRLCRLLESLN